MKYIMITVISAAVIVLLLFLYCCLFQVGFSEEENPMI